MPKLPRYAVTIYHGKVVCGWTYHRSKVAAKLKEKEFKSWGYITRLVDLRKGGIREQLDPTSVVPFESSRFVIDGK